MVRYEDYLPHEHLCNLFCDACRIRGERVFYYCQPKRMDLISVSGERRTYGAYFCLIYYQNQKYRTKNRFCLDTTGNTHFPVVERSGLSEGVATVYCGIR
jgi:hypothetical protein